MMIKLKCLFLKLLKPLFIISLISCFTFLVSSSVNANYYSSGYGMYVDLGDFFSINGTSYRINDKLNFTTIYNNNTKNVFYGVNNYGAYDARYLYAWYNDDLYFAFTYSQGSAIVQGFIDNRGVVSKSTADSYSNGICAYMSAGNITFDSKISSILDKSFNSVVLCSDGQNSPLASYSNNLSLCFTDGSYYYCVNGGAQGRSGLTGGSLGLPSKFDFDTLDNYSWSNSPSGIDLNPPSDKIYYSDNNQIYYDTFKALGFYDGLCYSNFLTSDIVDNNTSYYDLFPSSLSSSGASVFDLYNSWNLSNNNPFSSWFSWYSSRYDKLNQNPSNSNLYGLYSGVSKGNYSIFDKIYHTPFIESYSFSPIDYNTFCDMAINGFDSDGLFTGKTSISFDNIMISSPCIRNGTCISEDGEFVLSGANELGYFSGDADIFDVFNSLYSQFRYAFTLDKSLIGTSGLLPTYIIFGFLLFLLLYIFRR